MPGQTRSSARHQRRRKSRPDVNNSGQALGSPYDKRTFGHGAGLPESQMHLPSLHLAKYLANVAISYIGCAYKASPAQTM